MCVNQLRGYDDIRKTAVLLTLLYSGLGKIKDPRRKRRGIPVCRCSSTGLTPQAAGDVTQRGLKPGSPDGSRRILPRTPDLLAGSATYANRQTPVRVGAAGESKTNPRRAVQVSEFPWRTVPKGHPDSNPSGESGVKSLLNGR